VNATIASTGIVTTFDRSVRLSPKTGHFASQPTVVSPHPAHLQGPDDAPALQVLHERHITDCP